MGDRQMIVFGIIAIGRVSCIELTVRCSITAECGFRFAVPMYLSTDIGARLCVCRIRCQFILKVSTLPIAFHRIGIRSWTNGKVLTVRHNETHCANVAVSLRILTPFRSIETEAIHRHVCIAAKAICSSDREHRAVHRDTDGTRCRPRQMEMIFIKISEAPYFNLRRTHKELIGCARILGTADVDIRKVGTIGTVLRAQIDLIVRGTSRRGRVSRIAAVDIPAIEHAARDGDRIACRRSALSCSAGTLTTIDIRIGAEMAAINYDLIARCRYRP